MRSSATIKLTRPDNAEAPEQRESKRMQFYRGEFPEATIEYGGRRYTADVYDLSTAGIAVLPRNEIAGLDTLSQEVKISIGGTTPRPATLQNITHIKFSGSLRLKLGFKIYPGESQQHLSSKVFQCEDSMPLAYCDDSVAFNRTILFNIVHFSQFGIGMRTTCEEGILYPGLRLDLRVMMPARGEFQVVAEVVHTQRHDRKTEVKCLLANPSDALRNSISEFLLMTVPGLTIKDLAANGFQTVSLEKSYLFRSVQSPVHLESILKLRLKAAQHDGRWAGETDFLKMTDPWDKHARQIFCEVNSQVVASARIVFNNGLPERSEHVSYGVTIPAWLWEEGFVESSRVCTDPDYRGADIFSHVIQHVTRIVAQSGYRYILINCVDSLVPVYRKTVGVFPLKQRFHTEFMQGRALNLLCIDTRAMQVGVNLLPATWSLNAPVGSFLLSTGALKLKWWERPLRFAFRALHRVAAQVELRQRRAKANAKGPAKTKIQSESKVVSKPSVIQTGSSPSRQNSDAA